MNSIENIIITPDSFVELEDDDEKLRVLEAILNIDSKKLDFNIKEWVKKAFRNEALRDIPSERVVIKMTDILNDKITEKDIRLLLSNIFLSERSTEGNPLYFSIKNSLITALGDDLPEVRDWAITLLQEKGEFNGSDNATIEHFLIDNLRNEKSPCIIRENAVIALGEIGSPSAVGTLISAAEELLGRTHAEEGSYENTVNRSLKEKIGYSLGFAATTSLSFAQKVNMHRIVSKLKQSIDEHIQVFQWALQQIHAAIIPDLIIDLTLSLAYIASKKTQLRCGYSESEYITGMKRFPIVVDGFKYDLIIEADGSSSLTLARWTDPNIDNKNKLSVTVMSKNPTAPILTFELTRETAKRKEGGHIVETFVFRGYPKEPDIRIKDLSIDQIQGIRLEAVE